MATVKEIQERRAPIGVEIRKMADTLGPDKPDFTAEERSKWDRLNADFDGLTKQIDVARRAEEVGGVLESRQASPPGTEDTEPKNRKAGRGERERAKIAEEVRAIAMQAWCRRQYGMPLTAEQRRACKLTRLNPNRESLDIRLPRKPVTEERAMSVGTNTAGGYTVPTGFVVNFEKALKAYDAPRQVADVIRTDTGNPLPWPTTNDTGNVGELLAENTGAATQDVVIGQTTFNAYKFSSKLVLVSEELLEDSAFDLNTELAAILGERIGRAQASYQTTGTGTSQPAGIVTGATLGKTGASSTAIAADEILDLIHSVDPAYRMDPSFGLMFSDTVFAAIRKLKDTAGRYLFNQGTDGEPDRIWNVPLTVNQNMTTAITTGQKTMLAGAFRYFKIRDVNTLRLKRLVERYGEVDQVGFVAFARMDSKVLNAGGNPIKYYAQL